MQLDYVVDGIKAESADVEIKTEENLFCDADSYVTAQVSFTLNKY